MKALEKLHRRMEGQDTLVCVGLDPDWEKIPEQFRGEEFPQFAFNRWLIEQTHPYVCAYKPNFAFYEARGSKGVRELEMTIQYLREHHPDIFTIADAKRGDIGNTNAHYAVSIFDVMGFDAVTLHPYTGREGLAPFLERVDKGSIILCRTSNPGSAEFQNVQNEDRSLWETVARHVSQEWNTHDNCMLVVGATYPDELAQVRAIVGEMTLLIPGIGAQGGDLLAIIQAGKNTNGKGMIITASRSVIFAEEPAREAKKLRDQIRKLT